MYFYLILSLNYTHYLYVSMKFGVYLFQKLVTTGSFSFLIFKFFLLAFLVCSRFDTPPTDVNIWRKAQNAAATGEQVLLQHIIKLFPNHLDFLDGDPLFRIYHKVADIFVDNFRTLEPLTKSFTGHYREDQIRKYVD